ncbi:aldo/keto reductase [Earliella scabrosa]|nr:aldo/keto reductase [Earliella scabrosa]
MVKTTTLGGTASNVVVAKVAHGLMMMTMSDKPVLDEQAFESIKSGVDALPPGVKMMLNSSEFYGQGFSVGNLELLARFYEKYPDYVDKTFLAVKGAFVMGAPKCKPEELRQSVDNCIAALRGTKKIDLFQPARIDPEVSVEDTVRSLAELVREGKFDHIGLSECAAETLRRGHAVHPISVAEIEISPMSYEEETIKVLATAAELDIAIAAYSPLAHGMTTGKIKSVEDFPAGSRYRDMTRIKDENWEYNKRLVDALVAMAAEKKCTPAQLSIAWVGALGEKVIPLPGSSKKERTLENLYAADVELTKEDLDKIAKIMETNPVRGDRAFGPQVEMRLWG